MPILESCIVGGAIVGGSFILHKLVPNIGSKIEDSWKKDNYKIVNATFSQNQPMAVKLLRYIIDYQFSSNNGRYANVDIKGTSYTVPLNKLHIERGNNRHRIYFKVITDSSSNILGVSVFTFIKKYRFQLDTDRICAFDNFIAYINSKSIN